MTVALQQAVLALLLAGCIPRVGSSPARTERFTTGEAAFDLEYSVEDAGSAERVKRALAVAAPHLIRWGGLRLPVTITIHPSHQALERAVHRAGYGWLRAWARFDSVDLQSPRAWGLFGPSDGELAELLTHELTHCAMYQAAGNSATWAYKRIPLWFREGMASVSAGQAYRRASCDELRRYYLAAAALPGARGLLDALPGGDPVVRPEPLYQSDSEVVYGAAHRAFEFLLARYGEERVRAILAAMSEGDFFSAAFERATGISDEAFAADFKRYVVWHGWR